MKTFYDVLKISENATQEEIDFAYKELKEKYRAALKDPFNSSKAEELLKRLDVAYQVLGNEETKKSYDKDIANMRANELMNNLQQNTNSYNDEIKQQEEIQKREEEKQQKQEEEKKIAEKKLRDEQLNKAKLKFVQEEIERQIQEQQKQIKKERKNQKKVEEARAEEYRSYLRKLGVNVKEPLTVKRFFKILGATVFVLLIVFLILQIPSVKNSILNSESLKSFLELFK